MTPEQQTIEKIAMKLAGDVTKRQWNAHPTEQQWRLEQASVALSVIREIVLAEVRKLEEVRDFDFKVVSGQTEWRQRPRTAAEIEAALIEVLGGEKEIQKPSEPA